MKSPHSLIIKPLLTEKSTELAEQRNQYHFRVARQANKIEIKKAIQQVFDVKVKKVTVMNVKGKPRKVRFKAGKTAMWKKAIITLEEGHSINVI